MHKIIQQNDLRWNWKENRDICWHILQGNDCNKLKGLLDLNPGSLTC